MSSNGSLEHQFFQCEICSEKFVKKYNLTRHMVRKHPQVCKTDPQQNNHNPQQNSRNPQQNNHNEEMANKCPHCDKQFVANWRLVRHVEKCKGEKSRFECEHCLKQFTHERSRFKHYKICTEKIKPQPIINNNITNINAETYIQNQTNNNNIIIVYGEQFNKEHLTKEDLKRLVELASPHVDSRFITEYTKYVFVNKENRCVKKTNLKLNHSQIHVGDDKWELQLDSVVYPKLANDMCEYLYTQQNKLRREVFEKLRNFADNGYINTEDIDRKKIIQKEYKKFVNGLKLLVYDSSK